MPSVTSLQSRMQNEIDWIKANPYEAQVKYGFVSAAVTSRRYDAPDNRLMLDPHPLKAIIERAATEILSPHCGWRVLQGSGDVEVVITRVYTENEI